ncbi:MAG: alpha-E domain-containing protein, partial [Polyangiaceae bacterium]|nr:alpha-E domain-containing protein [Polyangiaceae bacterium]
SAARENARTVRDVISREMWEELNALYLMVREARKSVAGPEDMAEFYERVKRAGFRYAGATDATMSHGEAWHFSQLGRMIERADKTSRILDVKYYILLPELGDVGSSVDQVGWTALLNSASALQMYRQRHHVITPRRVAQFLLLSNNFPRSIRHCVHRVQDSLHEITGTPIGSYRNQCERIVGMLRSGLDYAEMDEVMKSGLHEYLDELQTTLNDVGKCFSQNFFHLKV